MGNNMRIRKVKATKEKKIVMVYDQKTKKGSWDEYSFSCSEDARPEFYAALKELAQDVITMCELPENYLDRITVKGVSYSYGGENDTMGATISASMKLKESYQELNLNTPHKASEMYCAETPVDEMQLLYSDCIERLEALHEECLLYIKGDRAQGSLFPAEDAA